MSLQTISLYEEILHHQTMMSEDDADKSESVSYALIISYLARELHLLHMLQAGTCDELALVSLFQMIQDNHGEAVFIVDDESLSGMLERFCFVDRFTILRQHPLEVCPWLEQRQVPADLLTIPNDASGLELFRLLNPFLRPGGVLVLEGNTFLEQSVIEYILHCHDSDFEVLFKDKQCTILYKIRSDDNCIYPIGDVLSKTVRMHYTQCLPIISGNVYELLSKSNEVAIPSLFIGILHLRSVKELERSLCSIFDQLCNVDITIQVFGTSAFLALIPPNVSVPVNMTVSYRQLVSDSAYEQMFQAFKDSGCTYFSLAVSGDFFSVPLHIHNHIAFLQSHPECALTFNPFLYWLEEQRQFSEPKVKIIERNTLTIFDLFEDDFIGYWQCAMIRRSAVSTLDVEAIRRTGEHSWNAHLLLAQAGDIGYVPQAYTLLAKRPISPHSDANVEEALAVFDRYTENRYLAYTSRTIQRCMQMRDSALKKSLLIIDDVFPSPVSSFRYSEFMYYLQNIKGTTILSNGSSLGLIQKKSLIETVADFRMAHPGYARQVFAWEGFDCSLADAYKIAYICFLNNAYNALPYLEMRGLPFILELYPGGGFALDNEETDRKLRAIFMSQFFRKVITTQEVTKRYLLDKGFCREEEIFHIFGVVIPAESFMITDPGFVQKIENAPIIQICFAAMRYSPRGEDKGYDIFIEVAKRLHRLSPNYRFTVVGNFDKSTIDVVELCDSIHFLGVLTPRDLTRFFANQHIILSPNRANALSKGAFDGFPTATCIEAGLQNTLIMCTDPKLLHQDYFVTGENIEIITEEADEIVVRIQRLNDNRKLLAQIIRAQRERIVTLYGIDQQLLTRQRFIEAQMQQIVR